MRFLIDFQFQKINRGDLELTFESERGIDALTESRYLPAVDHAEPILNVPCKLVHGRYHRRGSITGLHPSARLTLPRDIAGRVLSIPDSGLLMTAKMAKLLGVSVGDSVTIQPTRGLRPTVHAPVARVAQSYLGSAVYANIHYLNRLIGETMAVTGVQLQVQPDPHRMRALYRELKRLPALSAVSSRRSVIENLNQTFLDVQYVFIGLITLFAGVIFFGSTLNASLVSLTERTREIATLRVLGYSQWQIGRMFLQESALVNFVGALVGLPLGYGLQCVIARAYDTDLLRLPVVAPPWVWLSAIAAAITFSLAAHAVVQWRIHRIDWASALQVKE